MDVPLLLAAVSATSPCGEDLEYDADYLHLERAAQGQPERSMGDSILPAEPPEWRSIQQQSLDLLQRSKDLRITHFLLQSALALQGIAGLADALTLINALLREYWADLHPRLDADDDNDPTVQVCGGDRPEDTDIDADGYTADEALQKGMAEKSKEFKDKGNEVYLEKA